MQIYHYYDQIVYECWLRSLQFLKQFSRNQLQITNMDGFACNLITNAETDEHDGRRAQKVFHTNIIQT